MKNVLLLTGAIVGVSAVAVGKPIKPNIIYILVDDLGLGDLGCYGQKLIKTPCIDRMAAEGMLFTNHYAGSSVSAPSRCSLLSGLHSGHSRIRSLNAFAASGPVDFTDDDVLVSHELKRAGYQTGIIGKWGLSEMEGEKEFCSMPTRRGFDFFFGYKTHTDAHHYYPSYLWRNLDKVEFPDNDWENTTGEYSHDLFAKEAREFVIQNRSTPFFLYLAYTIPHYELTVPENSKEPYQNQGWPQRPLQKGHYRHDAEGNVTYAAMISRLDKDVGALLDLLRELGIAENTLVIFASDNGPEYDRGFFGSNGGLRGRKRDLYEGGIKVPMIAWMPSKIKAGSKTDHLSAFWDFLPTACDLAGIAPSVRSDGISFKPVLFGDTREQPEHDYLYWEVSLKQGPIQAIRWKNWKMVKFLGKEMEIYDLETDPTETTDVAASNPEVVEKMQAILSVCRTDNPDFPIDRFAPGLKNNK